MSEPGPPVRVLFFAGARDAAGVAEAEVFLALRDASIEEFAAEVTRRFPGLAPYVRVLRVAVNGAYASRGERVRPGDEVAFIPPVAGG